MHTPESPSPPAPATSAFAARVRAALTPDVLSRLLDALPASSRLPKRLSSYEWDWVPLKEEPPVACDCFTYWLLVDAADARFWVMISGGIAGRTEYRGPAALGPGGPVALGRVHGYH